MASKNDGNESSVLSRPTTQIIQNFLLVWLDAHLNESTPDFKNNLAQLRRIVASIRTYKDVQECIQFIQQVKDQKVLVLVSGALGQRLVPDIHEWNKIESIYIFCRNKPFHKKWSKNYPKVKGVHTHLEPICKALETDRQRCDQNTIPVSFQDSDTLFMYTQLVKEAILQIEYDEADSLKEFVAFCRQQDDIDEDEIKQMEMNYKTHTPIWWYTAPMFMYSMLNRGLRVFDADILMKMGFFMSQLDRHIQELSRQQHANPEGLTIIGNARFEVYRGQGLTIENFKKLNKCIGRLMSFNNFLSTSYNKDVSLRQFARPAAFLTDSVGILFIMQIDTDLCKNAKVPFVEITGDIGFFQDREAEILFTTHTLFKIEKVQQLTDPDTDRLYQVNLTVASPDTHELKEVADSLNKEVASYTGFSRLAYVLIKSGLSEQARDMCHALLEKATTDDDIAEYNFYLGWVCNNMGDYKKAIHYYEEYYKIKRKTLPTDDSVFAKYYNNIGNVHYSMGDYSKALSSYQQSFEIRKQVLPPNHPDLANSYQNIGNVYYRMGNYSKALSLYRNSLKIRKQVCPRNHPDFAKSYWAIAQVYESMGEYKKSLEYYDTMLEIQKQVLPPNHPDLAMSYHNIGLAYSNMGHYSKALSSYQQSLNMQKQILPPDHPNLANTYNNIGTVYSKMGNYSKALSLYQRSLNMQKQILPPNHPELANSYHIIGLAHSNMGHYSKALSSCQQSLNIQRQILPPNHPDLANTYNSIGTVYDNMGNYSKALSLYQQSLNMQKQILPPNHPNLANSYHNIGWVYYNVGDYSKALSYYEESLRIKRISLPERHPETKRTVENIALVKKKMQDNVFSPK